MFQSQNKLVQAELESAVNEDEILEMNLKAVDESLSQAETEDTLQTEESKNLSELKVKEKAHYEQELDEAKSKIRVVDSALKDLQEKGENETRELNRIKQALTDANERLEKIRQEEADREKVRDEKRKKGEEQKNALQIEKDKAVGEAKSKLDDQRKEQEQSKEKESEVLSHQKGIVKDEKIIVEDLERELARLRSQMDQLVRDLKREADIARELERLREEDERIKAEAIEKQKLELERENAKRLEEEAERQKLKQLEEDAKKQQEKEVETKNEPIMEESKPPELPVEESKDSSPPEPPKEEK